MKEKKKPGKFEKEELKKIFQEFSPIKALITLMMVWEKKKDSSLEIIKNPTDSKIQKEVQSTIKNLIPNESFLEFFTDIMSTKVYLNKSEIKLLSKKIENKNLFSQINTKFKIPVKKYLTDFLFFAKISKKEESTKEKFNFSKNFLIKGGSSISQLILKPIEYTLFVYSNPLIQLLTNNVMQLIMCSLFSWQVTTNGKKNIPIANPEIRKGGNEKIIVRDPDTLREYVFDTLDDAIKFILKNKWYILLLYILFLFRKPIINVLNSIREDIMRNPTIADSLKRLKNRYHKYINWGGEIYRTVRGYSATERQLLQLQLQKLNRKFNALKKLIEHLHEKIEMDADKILKYKDYSLRFEKELLKKELELAEINKVLKYVKTQFPECFEYIEDLKDNGVPDDILDDINLDMKTETE